MHYETDQLLGDSAEYELIYKGIELSKDVDGMCMEIGLRLGGGSKLIMDGIADFCPGKIAIAIDPFGNIPYEHKEGEFIQYGEVGYTNYMMSRCLANIYPYAIQKNVQFIFFKLEDTEYFNRFADGVPTYLDDKKMINLYSFVHFDGPHAIEPLIDEIEFFLPRSPKGAVWCFDDIGYQIEGTPYSHYYDHDAIERYIFDRGFELIEKGHVKAIYRYVG